jgi:methylglutaconyl-CoA hydratase
MSNKILYSSGSGIATITLNRPEKRNALDREMVEGMQQALTRSASDAAVRVVVITGAGQDFCAGADLAALQQLQAAGPMENLVDARRLADLFLDIRRHPRPIVAMVRGRALAGGCGVATSADIVLAAESAQFGYPEIKIGFVPAMVMAILRRSVAERRAFELLATGETIPAPKAMEIGLINHVYADDVFEAEAGRYVTQLVAHPPSALALTKSLMYQMDGLPFEAALSAGVQTNALARLTDDYRRGIEQFLKKS